MKVKIIQKTMVNGGQEHESEIEADLKTSKLLLFAPVVEGCDQNYNHLKLSSVKNKPFVFCLFPVKKQILHPVTDYR